MDFIAECRYNSSHRVKKSRLLIHEQKCPDKKCSKMVNCPYNPTHKVSFMKIESHKKTCPDKPQIDEALQNEMKAYIQQMKKEAEGNLPKSKSKSSNHTSASSFQAQTKDKVIEEKEAQMPNIREEDIFNLGDENGVVEYNDQEDDYNIDDDVVVVDDDDGQDDKENGVFDNVYQ